MKKISVVCGVLLTAVLVFIPLTAEAANVQIDNQIVQYTLESGEPFIDQANRTQVPFRQTMEQFGCSVDWDSVTRTAIAEKDGIVVKVPIGAAYIYKNDQKIANDTAALIKDGRTYLPIRAVFEAFDANVGWDAASQTVIALTGGQAALMTVHFIDVGQGDAIFVDYGDYEVLVDAGGNGYGSVVAGYIAPYVDGYIDLVIATHVHADHIGGLDDVIEAFEVARIIDSGEQADTASYEDYIAAVTAEGCDYAADEDMTLELGGGASLQIMDITDGQSNQNNNSVVALLDYNDIELLLTGDMESESEYLGLELRDFTDVDILKAGHHGSRTSSSSAFINVVLPETVIISAGVGNQYGHPHLEALQRFSDIGAAVYGTYKSGTVILTTNGVAYSLDAYKLLTAADVGANTDNGGIGNATGSGSGTGTGVSRSEAAYIGNNNSNKFHSLTCRWAGEISTGHILYFRNRDDAVAAGYEPCKVCNP